MALFGFGKDEENKKDADVKAQSSDTKKVNKKEKKEVKSVKKADKADKSVAKKETKKEVKEVKKETGGDAASAYGIIVAPIMTEKSHSATDQRTYTFRIRKDANKARVRTAVEGMYGVEVEKVRVLNMPMRRRTIGRNRGYQSAYKKALVTVKTGNKIDFFEGV